ncbi:G patch domain-containing 3 [Gossypium australe]|uniref:G patch domain-containing 3 n=1 Tax=Gossypium australe TaxID=47621 RepID=A0A5B6X688_9ROSI|nr:G patch domain-containing 3 [Gossypium australe]
MMAVDLHNFELLLPSLFFTPQDNLGSELSSPIGSDQPSSSSTDSTREEDDYIGELTRQMAQYMLPDDDKLEKSWGLAGSPESTLWSQFGSNLDGPIGPSREPSPPMAPWVGNFEKMKITEETARYNQGEKFSSTSNSIQVSGGNLNAGIQSKQALIDDQIRAIQLYRLKQEQAMKQMEQKPRVKHYNQNKGRVFGGFNNGQKAVTNSNNPWYNLQPQQQQQQQQSNQQAGSHMRAVFLNASGSRNGSSGTGVFLPRGIGGTPTESRKKQGCATVLIPARVVQALKLHFEKTGVPTRSSNSAFHVQHDACVSGRNNSMHSLQKYQSKTVPALNHQEMNLPQEWTY